MKQLTEDEFDEQFTIVPGADGESIRDDHQGVEPDSRNLWTIVDESGSLYAVTGVRRINRLGYILTEESWDEDIEAVWHLCADVEDQDEDEEKDGQ